MCPLKGRFLDIFTIYITSGTKEFFKGKHDAGVRKVVSNLYIYPKTESCWRGGGGGNISLIRFTLKRNQPVLPSSIIC